MMTLSFFFLLLIIFSTVSLQKDATPLEGIFVCLCQFVNALKRMSYQLMWARFEISSFS